jgi:hypothetical protein
MTSAELLDLFNDLTGRAAADSIQPTKKYTWLARAEQEVVSEIATVRPSMLYQKVGTTSLPTLQTTDNNVFTFGTGIEPFGRVQIYRRTSDIPDRPLVEDWDFLSEGNQIRLVRNRHLSGPLYWRGIVMPTAISADEPPHLIPTAANELTAIRAARNFAESGNLRNAALADRMRIRWKERWPYWCLVWKQQFRSGGILTTFSARDLVTPLL